MLVSTVDSGAPTDLAQLPTVLKQPCCSVMASGQFVNKLQEEVICPICLDILQKPVTIDCGHNFCLKCITQIGETSCGFFKCPLCKTSVRKNAIRFNSLLWNLVEKIQALQASEVQSKRKEATCPRHQEMFHYFCEDDGKFLCFVCRESKDHKSHNVSLIEEAAQNYQGQIQEQIQVLQQKEKETVQVKAQGVHRVDVFTDQVEHEKQRILTEFELLHQVLEEEKNFLLSRIYWLGHEGTEAGKHYVASTEPQLNDLKKLIDSLKTKQNMPPRQLLEDIKVVLCSEEFQFLNPTPVPLELEKKLSEAKSRHDSITGSLKKFKDQLQADRKKDENRFFKSMNKNDMKSWGLLQKNNHKMNKTSEPRSSSAGASSQDTKTFDAALSEELHAALSEWLTAIRAWFREVPSSQASSENTRSGGATRTSEHRVALSEWLRPTTVLDLVELGRRSGEWEGSGY
ncbi:E3 ubiquitin-protein ligase TRIM31 isoform X11 [Pan troglodytes]|uniref:E3 ubiquitin-protein ligase TRIM31 isoform X11 n=1 Tax=Pan troglodytes TaxID=9598 RepID=UPI0023F0D0F7|nr:E3 ubiquitin-protein ligase TRIM31 isoform X11 [Pan troglodytes]